MAASPGSSSGPGSGSGPGAAGAGAVRWFLVRVAAAVAATAIVLFVGGFLLYQTSGLSSRAAITTSTAVGKVNGTEITYIGWQNPTAQLVQQQEQQLGRGLTLDERAQLERVGDVEAVPAEPVRATVPSLVPAVVQAVAVVKGPHT